MSLKSIIKKSIAATMTLSILFGNCSLCGIGLSKVIAENLTVPEVVTEIQNERYVQYKKVVSEENIEGEEKVIAEKEITSVALESKLSVFSNQTQDTYMPIEDVEIGINLPRINNCLPEKAIVVDAKTKATTGEDLNKNINQNYDSNSGLLTITYENIPNQEGNIYSEYIENAKDEFKIIYSYPSQAYIGNDEEIKLEYNINTKATFKAENESLTSQISEKIELTEKENRGDIATFRITELKGEIYKGFMYSNVENKSNHDTEYNTVAAFNVLNTAFLDEIVEIDLAESKFVLADEETEIEANGNIIYKTTQISRYEFDRMIGTNGHIEIYGNDELIVTVKYLDIDNENKLCIINQDGQVNILDNSNEVIDITYPANISSLKFKMSKPLTEGYMHFENKNVIVASQDYGYDVKDIKFISTEGIVKEITKEIINGTTNEKTTTVINIMDIELLEPETKVSVTSSNENFSTLQPNQTTITVKLEDTNPSAKLFNNPIITVKLPEGVTAGNLSSPRILSGNGLELKDAITPESNVIKIELEGKQTSYDLNNIAGGATIVMDIENLQFSDTIPTHEDKIIVTCEQNKEIVNAQCNVNIVSKAGLLVMSKLSNYNKENTTTTIMGGNTQVIEIGNNEEEKEVINTLNLVNNHDQNLSNVQIIGRIDYSDENLKTTFATSLTKAIKVSDENIKVYYSANVNANYEDDSWSEEYNENAKAIKMVLDNNEFAKATSKEIKTYLKVPSDLGFNQENYIKWEVAYNYNENTVNSETTVGMLTEKSNLIITNIADDTEVSNSSSIEVKLGTYGQDYGPEMDGTIRYNVNETVEYVITVKNLTQNKLHDVKVEYKTPENLKYKIGGIAKYDEFEGYLIEKEIQANNNDFEYTIKTLKANEEIEFVVIHTVEQLESVYSAEITTIANASVNNETYKSNEKTISLLQSAFEISLDSNISEEQILKVGDSVTYTATIKNIGKRANGVEFEDNIPNQIEVNKIEYGILDGELNVIQTSSQNIKLSLIVNENETLVVKITGTIREQEVEETAIFDLVNVAKISSSDIEILSNEIKLKYEVVKIEDGTDLDMGETPIEKDDPVDIEDPEEPETPEKPEEPSKPEEPEQPEQPETPEEPSEPEQPQEPETPEEPEQPEQPETPENPNQGNDNQEEKPNDEEEVTYSISGIAWLDQNKDGKIDENEALQENIKVSLVNKDIGNFALDKDGNRIITTTDNTGKYIFNNITKGNYLVLFEFDTNKYTVATYKKSEVEETKNSDVVITTVTIDGTQKLAAITDAIQLNSNQENINIGLMENAKFDLSLNKQITQITVKNSKGTENYEYEEGDTAKVDLVAKYMDGAEVIVTYKFTVKNEGEVTGYVESLVDEIPDGLEFSKDLNKNWNKGTDGKLYYTALSGTGIKPGESTQVELVLTKTMTEESTGVFPNSAKLEKISNLENIQEDENALENNQSSAMLIISIKTGTIFMYIGITLLCTAIILTGTYFIKKKVLNVEI